MAPVACMGRRLSWYRTVNETRYFQQAFHPSRYLPLCASDSAFADFMRFNKFHLLTYLLTYLL